MSYSDPLPNMSESEDDSISMGASSDSDEVRVTRSKGKKTAIRVQNSCMKLMLPEHLAAYMEERELDRDVEPVQCSEDVIEKIFGNYLIVKNILSHLRWQEKLICKDVCPLWASAVNRLQFEQLWPVDFSINASFHTTREGLVLLKSSEFYTEPMAVFTFCNSMGLRGGSVACEAILSCPCLPPCDMDHCILDVIHQEATAPRDCMYIVKASSMSYMPLPHSLTMENTIEKPIQGSDGTFYGMYIPMIPGVKFIIMNTKCSNDIQEEILPEVKKLIENYTVKGVVACLTENYLLYADNAECLEFLHAIQPNAPFAFGGCLVEETANTEQDLVGIIDCVNKGKEYISGNVLSLGLFVTPKVEEGSTSTSKESSYNFETYSFVLESSEWSRPNIKQAIQEFSESVPRFEHSVALKFSCVGRQHKHEAEQHCFRACFPHTRLVGCFGNGELGVNHPPRPPKASRNNKRPRKDPTYEKVHSYSTVFFYIGWGKIVEAARRDY